MLSNRFDRRRFGQALLAFALPAPFATRAQVRSDTVRVLCGYPPGGSVDIVGRKLAEKLTGRIAANAVVENKPGAAGRLAVDDLKRSAADGTTLLLTPASVMTLYPHVYRRLAYDVFADVVPVCSVAATEFALAVGPMVPASVTTFEEFVAWCKSTPTAPACGNAGAGSLPHLMAMLLAREAHIELAHIPYRGGSASMQGAAAGEVPCAIATEAGARPLVQAGKLRVLVTTGTERSTFFARVPTFAQVGLPALTQREWFGVFMPARTPAAGVAAIAEAWRSAAQDADVREGFDKIGVRVEALAPAELQAALRSEHDFWGPVVKASGFTPEA
ncbi:MAG: tripartite tricarboxylate transporter substrate-binding protein [Caldimonas sp.]